METVTFHQGLELHCSMVFLPLQKCLAMISSGDFSHDVSISGCLLQITETLVYMG